MAKTKNNILKASTALHAGVMERKGVLVPRSFQEEDDVAEVEVKSRFGKKVLVKKGRITLQARPQEARKQAVSERSSGRAELYSTRRNLAEKVREIKRIRLALRSAEAELAERRSADASWPAEAFDELVCTPAEPTQPNNATVRLLASKPRWAKG
ncbi:hypothetical protein [Alloyangia pacifica]|uniref:hypothetical protein n=1 Tax=Alloyangia pacifica TaxID=311180 RepID=UPI000B87F2E5|nr:hypothetical protein [Alloyangia pacifica]